MTWRRLLIRYGLKPEEIFSNLPFVKYQKTIEKKVIQTKYGNVAVDNRKLNICSMSGPKISPYLREKLVFIGQLDCYERGSELAQVLMNVQTNDTAIYRLTDSVGSVCEDLLKEE